MGSMVAYATSEWSYAQFRSESVEEEVQDDKAVIYGGYLHVVSRKGVYKRVEITAGALTNYTSLPLPK